jgi:CDP-6-deoxy-D-xylo-4-hexulose-3-dehydrase
MKGVKHRASFAGYPAADAVMRGGILLACHHGLTEAQLDYMHESFSAFARQYG